MQLNATILVLLTVFTSSIKRLDDETFFAHKRYFYQILSTYRDNVRWMDKIIHPSDRCGISTSWSNNIIAQVSFGLVTVKAHNPLSQWSEHQIKHVTHWACSGCFGWMCTTAHFSTCNFNTSAEKHWTNISQTTWSTIVLWTKGLHSTFHQHEVSR